MKNLISLILTFGFFIFLISCSKPEVVENLDKEFSFDLNSQIPYPSIKVENKEIGGKTGTIEMLVFSNMDALKLTLEELERQMEELDDAFLDFYSDLDGEELRTKEEQINYRQEIPLFEFGNFFAYHSLFKKIDDDEKVWLANEELDETNDPDNHFIPERSTRAILNERSEVQVGNQVFKMNEFGYYIIDANNLSALNQIDEANSFEETLLVPGVIFIGDPPDQGGSSNPADTICTGWFTKKADPHTVGDYRIKYKNYIRTYPWARYVGAKTINYKKGFLGVWYRTRSECYARVKGFISGADGNCQTQVNFNPNNNVAFEARARSVKHRINVSTRTKKIWLKSDHYGVTATVSSSN